MDRPDCKIEWRREPMMGRVAKDESLATRRSLSLRLGNLREYALFLFLQGRFNGLQQIISLIEQLSVYENARRPLNICFLAIAHVPVNYRCNGRVLEILLELLHVQT